MPRRYYGRYCRSKPSGFKMDMGQFKGAGLRSRSIFRYRTFGGRPSQCNSNNSGVEIYHEGSADMFTITGATHCDFESPTNFICTAACGGSVGEEGQSTIRQLTTSYVAWKLGLDAAALWWDEESAILRRLIDAGQVSSLR